MEVVVPSERLKKKRKKKMKREPRGRESLERKCEVMKMKNEGVL